MVEIEKKYQIGVRRFGLINWVGAQNLYVKEVNKKLACILEKNCEMYQFFLNLPSPHKFLRN